MSKTFTAHHMLRTTALVKYSEHDTRGNGVHWSVTDEFHIWSESLTRQVLLDNRVGGSGQVEGEMNKVLEGVDFHNLKLGTLW
jgi:hypothetical protein